MKRFLFLLLFLPFVAFGQDKYAPSKENKWGIGVGYRFGTMFDYAPDPIEVSLQYRMDGKHTIYATYGFSIQRGFNNREPIVDQADNYLKENNTWYNSNGIEVGYNYNMYIKKGFSLFGGAGLNFTCYKTGKEHIVADWDNTEDYIYYYDIEKSLTHWYAYSLAPHVGVRYTYKHIEGEIRYSVYLSMLHPKSTDIDETYNNNEHGEAFLPNTLSDEFRTTGTLSLKLSYYF